MDSIKRWGGEFLVSPLSLENGCGEDEELVTVKKKKKKQPRSKYFKLSTITCNPPH